MKRFKTSPKILSNHNYDKYQQSDILNQKGLNKPEISYTHKKMISNNTLDSSYNFLEWKEMSPHIDPNIKIKLNPNNISQVLNSKKENYLKYNLKAITPKRIHKNFYEKMCQNEPEKTIDKSISLNKNMNNRYQKETIFLGNYSGEEYKIKRNKTISYEPLKYLKQQNPLNIKMNFLYGGSEYIIGNYKPKINLKNKLEHSYSSIGYIKKEFETNNDRDNKIINDPKKMKYFLFYGNKGIENANKKLRTMTISKSTNSIYNPNIDCTKNRINFLKSNIFYDKEIDKKNNNDENINNNNQTIKVKRKLKQKKLQKKSKSTSKLITKYYNTINKNINNNININPEKNSNKNKKENISDIKNNSRKFLYKTNGEDNLPIKLDWRDTKTYLLFPQNKNRDILKKNSRQRKFKNLYDSEPVIPKEKLGQEFNTDQRKEIEEKIKDYYKNLDRPKVKKISDNISQYKINDMSDNQKIIDETINYNINDIKTKSYEIIGRKNRGKYNNINKEEIIKKFAKKGIHVYDIEENMNSIMNNKGMNKIKLKIRENQNDKKMKGKLKKIKKDYIKAGVLMKEKYENKKDANDLISLKLGWNTPNLDLFIKNKKLVNTNNGVTHLKGKPDVNNEEKKITKIFVNLKYKNRYLNS